jgi:integrase
VAEGMTVVGKQVHFGVPKNRKGKKKKPETITLPRFLVKELRAHQEDFPPGKDGHVFTDEDGQPINRLWFLRCIWKPALKKAGIKQPWPRVHDLRHTAASIAVHSGANIYELKERMRHQSITTTERYLHLFEGQDAALAARLDTSKESGLWWGHGGDMAKEDPPSLEAKRQG